MSIRVALAFTVVLVVLASHRLAMAQVHGCSFDHVSGQVTVSAETARLVARLINPPRARLTLSIDDSSGNHSELVWDPAINDGLQHSVLLQGEKTKLHKWSFSASAEDERLQTGQVIVLVNTTFKSRPTDGLPKTDGLTIEGSRKALIASTEKTTSDVTVEGKPTLILTCEDGQVGLSGLKLDKRRAMSAVTARGLLDQAVSAPVTEALSLLAEVAIDRAKSRAMELVKSKFVDPMCNKLTLATLGLRKQTAAFPQTCALLQQLRIDDVLSSGKSLVTAARDDIRTEIAPELVDQITVNDETRGLAKLALKLANRMIDGQSNGVVEVDLLVSVLDHLGWSNGFEKSKSLVLRWLDAADLTDKSRAELLEAALDRAIPGPFWDDPSSLLLQVETCKRQYRKTGTRWKLTAKGDFPNGYYDVPDRGQCIKSVVTLFTAGKHPNDIFTNPDLWRLISLEHLVHELPRFTSTNLSTFLLRSVATKLNAEDRLDQVLAYLDKNAEPLLARACAVRLVVGVTKWCSGRESCSAGDVSEALLNPRKLFKPTLELPEALCWVGKAPDQAYRRFANEADFIEDAVHLTSFLTPPPKGEERARAIAMIRWLFGVVRRVNAEPHLDQIERIVISLIETDYLRAVTESLSLARELCKKCMEIEPTKKAVELLGAVASYVQTYEATKTLDPAEARSARKKAIESLIDAATDRSGREGAVVYSLGSPVGFATGFRWAPGDGSKYTSKTNAFDAEFGFQWRVPLGLARQRLPTKGCLSRLKFWKGCGTHVGLWIADLGQFTRSIPNESVDSVEWNDFLGVGLQVGAMLGSSESSAVLAIEGSWAPGLFERDVEIMDGVNTKTQRVGGAFTFGVTLAYYVPFFDLN